MGQLGRLACAVLAATLLVAPLTGCGTSKTSEEARKELEKLKKEKPKNPFDQMRVFAEPNERSFTPGKAITNKDVRAKDPLSNAKEKKKDEEEDKGIIVRNAIKPGHWTGVLVEARANLFDFSGELVSEPRDNQQRLLELEDSPFSLVTSRPAALAKGQKKSLEAIFFSPPSSRYVAGADGTQTGVWSPSGTVRTSSWIYNQLRSPRHGIESQITPEPLPHMPAFQYFMVVLARDSNRYRFLKVLTCVNPPGEMATVADDSMYYRVVIPRPPRRWRCLRNRCAGRPSRRSCGMTCCRRCFRPTSSKR